MYRVQKYFINKHPPSIQIFRDVKVFEESKVSIAFHLIVQFTSLIWICSPNLKHLHCESLASGSKFSNTATVNQRPPESFLVVHSDPLRQ